MTWTGKSQHHHRKKHSNCKNTCPFPYLYPTLHILIETRHTTVFKFLMLEKKDHHQQQQTKTHKKQKQQQQTLVHKGRGVMGRWLLQISNWKIYFCWYLKAWNEGSRKNGSMVRITYCSCIRPEFFSNHPHWVSHRTACNSSSKWSGTIFWPPQTPELACTCPYTDIHIWFKIK